MAQERVAQIPPMWLTHEPRMRNTDDPSDEDIHARRIDEIEKRIRQRVRDDYNYTPDAS